MYIQAQCSARPVENYDCSVSTRTGVTRYVRHLLPAHFKRQTRFGQRTLARRLGQCFDSTWLLYNAASAKVADLPYVSSHARNQRACRIEHPRRSEVHFGVKLFRAATIALHFPWKQWRRTHVQIFSRHILCFDFHKYKSHGFEILWSYIVYLWNRKKMKWVDLLGTSTEMTSQDAHVFFVVIASPGPTLTTRILSFTCSDMFLPKYWLGHPEYKFFQFIIKNFLGS